MQDKQPSERRAAYHEGFSAFTEYASPTPGGRLMRHAMVACITLAMLALSVSAQAQTTFVSNMNQTDQPGTDTPIQPGQNVYWAQQFTTGTNTVGYALAEIEVNVHTVQAGVVPFFSLHESTTGDLPGDWITGLNGSVALVGAQSFTPANPTTLRPETKYFVVFWASGTTRLTAAESAGVDSGAAAGWNINGHAHTLLDGSWRVGQQGYRIKIAVKGTAHSGAVAIPGPPQTLMATAARSQVVELAWQAPTSGGARIIRYEYRYSTGSAVTGTPNWTSAGTKRTANVTDLTNGTGYAFEVRAVNLTGNGTAATATETPVSCVAVPSFGTRRQIWTGTVDIGVFGTPDITFSGFYPVTSTGTLSDTGFTIGPNSYVIDTIAVGYTSGSLTFSLNKNLNSAEKEALRLHVCGDSLDFSGAISLTRSGYAWLGDRAWHEISERTLHLSLPANNPATGAPTIMGTVEEGDTLTADISNIADADGLPATLSYQWVRVDGLNETDIPSATSITYMLTGADVEKNFKMKVRFTDNLGSEEQVTSDYYPDPPPARRPADPPCMLPNLPGRLQVWTGELKVGIVWTVLEEDMDLEWRYGFSTDTNNNGGSLDKTTFMVTSGSDPYTISEVSVEDDRWPPDSPGTLLAFRLDTPLQSGERAALRLHVCEDDMHYDFSSATVPSGGSRYSWPTSGLDWISARIRTLFLSVATGSADTDTTPPAPSTATVDGMTLVLAYSEELDPGSTPAPSDFTVMVDGTSRPVSTVVISGRTVRLTLEMAVTTGQTMTVSYTPGTRPLRDSAGNAAPALSNQPVTITDDDEPVVMVMVSFGVPIYTVNEGAAVDVTVRLSADPERQVEIPLTTTNRDGVTDDDYAGVPSSVTFTSGTTARTFTVTASDDDVGDGGESVQLGFGSPLPPGVEEGSPATTVVTITELTRSRLPPLRLGGTGGGGAPACARDGHGNQATQATDLELSTVTAGTICPAADVDYFTVTAPGRGLVFVDTTGGVNLRGTILQNETVLATGPTGSRQNDRLGARVQAGPVVVAVQGQGGTTGPYAVEITFVQGYLENPGADSFQSGIGVISGWVCEAEEIVIELNGAPQAAAYGTERLDTARVCGDTDNGFGLLFNWNLLGNGEHTVVALVDGVELSRTTVTVTTLGTEFVRDVVGSCAVADFPMAGETALLTWQQTSQNFVLASERAPSDENRRGAIDVGYLENPGPNSFQSGIGVLSGWACEGEDVVIELNGEPQVAAYGTERLDTLDACGDTDNGFGLLFNWNLLGDGVHDVVAYVDDVELGRATVRVTTLGAEFLRDVAGECTVADFPTLGETVTLEWQQNSQNFVITDME